MIGSEIWTESSDFINLLIHDQKRWTWSRETTTTTATTIRSEMISSGPKVAVSRCTTNKRTEKNMKINPISQMITRNRSERFYSAITMTS